MQTIAIIVNEKSGGSSSRATLETLFQDSKYSQFGIFALDSDLKSKISGLIEKGYTTIVAGGGDGTASAVAGVLIELGQEVKFAVLPLGTFNHFAKDIGMPPDIEASLDVISKGNTTYVDVGMVNDICFLNNSSLGVYSKLVKYREQFQKAGWRKGFALIPAFLAVVTSSTSIEIQFETETNTIIKKTPFVMISNNKYEMGGFDVGTRKNLDQGLLSIAIASDVDDFRLIRLASHAISNTLIEQEDFNVIGLKACTITSRKRFLDVSHDGEVSKMPTPLNYRILPKKLRVIIP